MTTPLAMAGLTSDPATPDAEGRQDKDQAEPVHNNGLPCPLCLLDLPPAPFDIPPRAPLDIPPPVQVTVPVGVSLGPPSLPLLLSSTAAATAIDSVATAAFHG
jgi:hypothetical protein